MNTSTTQIKNKSSFCAVSKFRIYVAYILLFQKVCFICRFMIVFCNFTWKTDNVLNTFKVIFSTSETILNASDTWSIYISTLVPFANISSITTMKGYLVYRDKAGLQGNPRLRWVWGRMRVIGKRRKHAITITFTFFSLEIAFYYFLIWII